MSKTRNVILHYHLFKNAGTSIDRILRDNFGPAWITREFPLNGDNNSDMVRDWIVNTPDAVAFSSHTMVGPIPKIDGVRIFTVMTLRDPIARIQSAYAFERKQGVETFGSTLARHTDLEGYVRVRLSMVNDRQCRDFQVSRLASMQPSQKPELDRALMALDELDVKGTVEQFGDMLELLQKELGTSFEGFVVKEQVHANRSDSKNLELSEPLEKLLREANNGDLALLDTVHSAK